MKKLDIIEEFIYKITISLSILYNKNIVSLPFFYLVFMFAKEYNSQKFNIFTYKQSDGKFTLVINHQIEDSFINFTYLSFVFFFHSIIYYEFDNENIISFNNFIEKYSEKYNLKYIITYYLNNFILYNNKYSRDSYDLDKCNSLTKEIKFIENESTIEIPNLNFINQNIFFNFQYSLDHIIIKKQLVKIDKQFKNNYDLIFENCIFTYIDNNLISKKKYIESILNNCIKKEKKLNVSQSLWLCSDTLHLHHIDVLKKAKNSIQENSVQNSSIQKNSIQENSIQDNFAQENSIQENSIQDNFAPKNSIQENSVQKYSIQENSVQKYSIQKNSIQENSVQKYSIQKNSIQENSIQDNLAQDNSIQDNSVQKYSIRKNSIQKKYIRENSVQKHSIQENSIQDSFVQDNFIPKLTIKSDKQSIKLDDLSSYHISNNIKLFYNDDFTLQLEQFKKIESIDYNTMLINISEKNIFKKIDDIYFKILRMYF